MMAYYCVRLWSCFKKSTNINQIGVFKTRSRRFVKLGVQNIRGASIIHCWRQSFNTARSYSFAVGKNNYNSESLSKSALHPSGHWVCGQADWSSPERDGEKVLDEWNGNLLLHPYVDGRNESGLLWNRYTLLNRSTYTCIYSLCDTQTYDTFYILNEFEDDNTFWLLWNVWSITKAINVWGSVIYTQEEREDWLHRRSS